MGCLTCNCDLSSNLSLRKSSHLVLTHAAHGNMQSCSRVLVLPKLRGIFLSIPIENLLTGKTHLFRFIKKNMIKSAPCSSFDSPRLGKHRTWGLPLHHSRFPWTHLDPIDSELRFQITKLSSIMQFEWRRAQLGTLARKWTVEVSYRIQKKDLQIRLPLDFEHRTLSFREGG